MAITKSFNRRTNTWYAYETSYVWDEALQKKVQKRKCIGKFDPETNQIVKNGPRGRPQLTPEEIARNNVVAAAPAPVPSVPEAKLVILLKRLEGLEILSHSILNEVTAIKNEINELIKTSASSAQEGK